VSGPQPTPVLDRLRARTRVTAEGCYVWTGATNLEGYGRLVVGSRSDASRRYVLAHRIAWELQRGTVPEDRVLDHGCHNDAVLRGDCAGGRACRHRPCWNVDHLGIAVQRDNVLRGTRWLRLS
jgi:hypothetical protein